MKRYPRWLYRRLLPWSEDPYPTDKIPLHRRGLLNVRRCGSACTRALLAVAQTMTAAAAVSANVHDAGVGASVEYLTIPWKIRGARDK